MTLSMRWTRQSAPASPRNNELIAAFAIARRGSVGPRGTLVSVTTRRATDAHRTFTIPDFMDYTPPP